MSDQKHTSDIPTEELLSALVDGELTEAEVDRLLECATPELLERYNRYQLAQDAMSKDTYVTQSVDVFANVSAAIEHEAVLGQANAGTQASPASHSFDESLSALVDNEATEFELRRILKSSDDAALEKLGRYHLISNVLKKEVSLAQAIDVSSRVSAAIANESVELKQPEPKKGLWANLGRVGIAASVAGALVVGVQFLSTSEPQNIADNTATPISGEPLINNGNSVRVVGNESAIKAIEETQDERDEALKKAQQ